MLPTLPSFSSAQFSSNSFSAHSLRDCGTLCDFFLCQWTFEGQLPTPKAFSENGSICECYDPTIHVPLPCYDERRWNAITTALVCIVSAGPSLTFQHFSKHFRSCATTSNGGGRPVTDFSALQTLIDIGWYDNRVLSEILPFIAQLALELPNCIHRPIRLLLAGKNGSLTLNRHQASVLLANAFFCTFPTNFGLNDRHFPRFDFNALFNLRTFRATEKLKFILHYFAQLKECPPVGTLSVIRQAVQQLPDGWHSVPLCGHLSALSAGRIEDEGAAHTQMDFANEFIGGGVLGHGTVQEEIRFLICPELIIACLICEKMSYNEAILLVGAERFSDYRGYCGTLRWHYRKCGNSTKRDAMGRALDTEVLAIDALCFAGPRHTWGVQFCSGAIERELLKAYAGFSLRTPESPLGIATGNWGCGAFAGDIELKSLIQWMAACLVQPPPHGRPLFYYTFGNERFTAALQHLVHVFRTRRVTVGDLFVMLVDYGRDEVRREFSWPTRKVPRLAGFGRLFKWLLRRSVAIGAENGW